MSGNLGESALRRKRRSGNPMDMYDTLPAPLRQWLSQAALPWSPASARRIWSKSRAQGLSADEALQALSRAEEKTLQKDKVARRCSGGPQMEHA